MKQNSLIDELPPWINKKAFQEFKKMRTKIRKPLTDYAEELIIKKLCRYHDQGFDITEILNQSIINDYQDVYPPKEQSNGKNQHYNGASSPAEKVERAIRERDEQGGRIFDAYPKTH